MTEIFDSLESNDKEAVEEAKRKLSEMFLQVRESWPLNGLYDYYLSTNSIRSMEVLANVNEPHHKYLFDRLSESLKKQETEIRVKALTLLGHIVRSHPPWIHKISEHHLFRDICYLLKNEGEILPLLSALLLIIVLIPMIPSLLGEYLYEVFEIFSRLASWNCNTGVVEEQMMVHLQVALYALFIRLYGMYPCNFLSYLRNQYREKNRPVFVHTIKPMLETVKMNPLLVTASTESEKSAERWKTKNLHDVIVECEQFSLDVSDKCHDCCYFNSGFRSRSGTTNCTIETKLPIEHLKSLNKLPYEDIQFYSPSHAFQPQTPPIIEASAPTNIVRPHSQMVSSHLKMPEGTSPPEAAIEATPETTPVRDLYSAPVRSPLIGSSVVRGLTTFGVKGRSASTTPTHSQPSSPMRKDNSPFNFPPDNRSNSAFIIMKKDTKANQRLLRLMRESSQGNELNETNTLAQKLPSSPVKIIPPETGYGSSIFRSDSPVSQDDEEVLSIVGQKEDVMKILRQCDSVLHDDTEDENFVDSNLEQGSPCTAGGLHMPNSQSLVNFANRVRRLRHHSQNYDVEPFDTVTTGSSPGKATQPSNSTTVRRANSCPDMKKSPNSTKETSSSNTLKVTEEELSADDHDKTICDTKPQKVTMSVETQTENFFPMPYEHLFLNIFPTLGSTEARQSQSPSPAPLKSTSVDKDQQMAYDVLDRYIDTSWKYDTNQANVQLQLLKEQLLFERYRRETHAYRNRRLFANTKEIKAMEEYNSALRDQVQLQQKDLDNLQTQLSTVREGKLQAETKLQHTVNYWEEKFKNLQDRLKTVEDEKDRTNKDYAILKEKCSDLDQQKQFLESSLLEALAEVNVAHEEALAGVKGRAEIEQLNKEILLFGELQMKYREKIEELEKSRKFEEENELITQTYKEELKNMQNQNDLKSSNLEAARSRMGELENIVLQKDETISLLKRTLMHANEENHEKIKAVESKYQAQITINRSLEEKILELLQKTESPGLRNLNSPETSSCHEAAATDRTTGLSPHSSPLSVSLASSESSTAFMATDIKEVKNLQILVDRKALKSAEENIEMSATDGESSQRRTSTDQD